MSVLSSNTPIYPVSFVSLGPGDPELITLKGLRILREADIIYCPSSVISPKGRRETAESETTVNTETEKKEKSGNTSRAAKILEALKIDSRRICLFPLPMSKDRDAALRTYDRIYEQAAQACRESKKAVIVAEGDAGFYSSVQYIYDRFIENGIPVERTAGVPAFIAAGALAGIHIVKQEEPLSVLPEIADCNVLLQSLEQGTNQGVHTPRPRASLALFREYRNRTGILYGLRRIDLTKTVPLFLFNHSHPSHQRH